MVFARAVTLSPTSGSRACGLPPSQQMAQDHHCRKQVRSRPAVLLGARHARASPSERCCHGCCFVPTVDVNVGGAVKVDVKKTPEKSMPGPAAAAASTPAKPAKPDMPAKTPEKSMTAAQTDKPAPAKPGKRLLAVSPHSCILIRRSVWCPCMGLQPA